MRASADFTGMAGLDLEYQAAEGAFNGNQHHVKPSGFSTLAR
jgi:hypothetical protein